MVLHPLCIHTFGMIKVRHIPPTGAQLQRPPACSHLTGDEERPAQASPPRTGRERLQTRLLRGGPAGETNTQVERRMTAWFYMQHVLLVSVSRGNSWPVFSERPRGKLQRHIKTRCRLLEIDPDKDLFVGDDAFTVALVKLFAGFTLGVEMSEN